MMVVFFHAYVITQEVIGQASIWAIFGSGNSGVQFFFVLSGFLMVAVHWGDFGRPQQFKRYALRRVTRIYPPYWAALALLFFGQVAMSRVEPRLTNPLLVLCDVLLLPTDGTPSLTVSWTLMHEMLFYSVFGLLIVSLRIAAKIFLLWQILILSAGIWQLAGGAEPGFPLSFLLSPNNLLFGMGMAAAILAPLLRHRTAMGLVAVGVSLFASVAWLAMLAPENSGVGIALIWGYGLAATMAIAGFSSWEKSGSLKIPTSLILLGDASYSIYLVHAPAMQVVAIILNGFGGNDTVGGWAVFAVLVATGTASGLIFFRLFERPMLKAAQRRLTRRRN